MLRRGHAAMQAKERLALVEGFQLLAAQAGTRVSFLGGASAGAVALSRLQTAALDATPGDLERQAVDPRGMHQMATGCAVGPPLPDTMTASLNLQPSYERVRIQNW